MENVNGVAPRDPGTRPGRATLLVVRTIDRTTDRLSSVVMLLLIPLIAASPIEVFMRYVMNQATTWAADVTVMSNGSLFMLGAAYAVLKGAHVRTDTFWSDFSVRTRGVIDAVAYLLLFLPTMAAIFWFSIDDTLYSWSIDERSDLGLWRPALWPFRAVIPVAATMLFAQGVSELLKAVWQAKTAHEFEHKEHFEV